jgi:seryl-tRNA synthetase
MIDLKDLRERPEAYQKACTDKRVKFDVSQFLKLDEEYRASKTAVEAIRAEQNKASKEVGKASPEDREEKLAAMKDLSARVKEESANFKELEDKWKNEQLYIAAIPLEGVPVGKDDTDNVLVRTVGEIPNFSFKAKDHVELGRIHDLMDIERGVKIAGARNYFLKGDGARLQHAALSLAMDLLHRKGYTIFDPPHIVNWQAMMGTSYFPGGEEMAYHLDERDEGAYLIGTSEVPVCAYHQDEILDQTELPKRYAGYSPCYRREAGTYGKDTHGLYRIHQFYKVEQVIICENDKEVSAQLHKEILGNAEELMQLLELPYRVVDVCTGDMGQGQVYKNDIETWMPSRESYGETHSCSTFHDFQARRLMLRYKKDDGSKSLCHTLNNTLIASPRVLIPLLEVHQQEDGSIRIPEALRPFMGGQESIG